MERKGMHQADRWINHLNLKQFFHMSITPENMQTIYSKPLYRIVALRTGEKKG